jgi:hypothetical protein
VTAARRRLAVSLLGALAIAILRLDGPRPAHIQRDIDRGCSAPRYELWELSPPGMSGVSDVHRFGVWALQAGSTAGYD